MWGTWDCCLAAADEVQAITGIDFAKDYRGYTDKAGAYRALQRVCQGGVREAATRELGQPQPALMAQRGDVCLVSTELGEALGWCIGSKVACAGPTGLTFIPLKQALVSWRV